jgi:hypothetical protein
VACDLHPINLLQQQRLGSAATRKRRPLQPIVSQTSNTACSACRSQLQEARTLRGRSIAGSKLHDYTADLAGEIEWNMAHLPGSDREAIAVYLKTIPARPDSGEG